MHVWCTCFNWPQKTFRKVFLLGGINHKFLEFIVNAEKAVCYLTCYDHLHHVLLIFYCILLKLMLLYLQCGSTTGKANNFNSGAQISPVVFYGSPHGVPPKRPSRLLLRLLHEIRVDLSEHSKSSLRYLCITTSFSCANFSSSAMFL